MLNHPGEDLVLQPDFLVMVERVDICLEYLQNHVSTPSVTFKFSKSHFLGEGLPRSRHLYSTFPTMPNKGNESDQDILYRFHPIARSRRRTADRGEGLQNIQL
jgi:hypothetical protein